MKVIIVEIDKDGKVTIDHRGFYGKTCFEADEKLYQLLKKLGADTKILNVIHKPEAHVKEKTKIHQT